MIPSREQCLAACASRDSRFDGWFIVAVKTTGIYCRPSCPTPVSPKPQNMSFYPSAASAQQDGYRACKRCRPDASPGSPEWNIRADLVGRAMRLIADGVVDRDGVPGLAARLAVSERHLNRLLAAEVGAGPLAIARAQRAQTARVLIETTRLSLAQIALAAGFRSVRQFNDTMREVFATAPKTLRDRGANGVLPGGAAIAVELPFRAPADAARSFAFLGARTIPGVETWDGQTYRRALRLPGGWGLATLRAADRHVACELVLESTADTQVAVQRCRRLLDTDADPVAIDAALAGDPLLRPLVAASPGLRAPGAVDGTEAVVRAIVGQQVSVAGARTVLGRLAADAGDRIEPQDGIEYTFPSPLAISEAPDHAFAMPARRRDAIREVCRRIARGEIDVEAGADRAETRCRLTEVHGIGPWTAEYVAMRALGDPDAFPSTDLGVRTAIAALHGTQMTTSALERRAEAWRPWRTYATHHLWHSLDSSGGEP